MSSNSPLRSFLFYAFVFTAHVHFTHALGVRFMTPAPGATYPSGQFAINWVDAGGNVAINNLTTYNLTLVVGGNLDSDSRTLMTLSPANALVSDLGLVAQIPANIGQSIQNGYYLSMISNVNSGGSVINYSNRFTLIGLNGTTDQAYIAAAATTVGDTNVPAAQLNTIITTPSPSNPDSPTPTSTNDGNTTSTSPPSATSDDGKTYSIAGGALAALLAGTLTSIVLFVILTGLGIFWWRRRRRRAKLAATDAQNATEMASCDGGDSRDLGSSSGAFGNKVELAERSSRVPPGIGSLAELDNDAQILEVHTPTVAIEADSSQIRYELEGDWAGWEAAARRSHIQGYDPTR